MQTPWNKMIAEEEKLLGKRIILITSSIMTSQALDSATNNLGQKRDLIQVKILDLCSKRERLLVILLPSIQEEHIHC